MKFWSVSVAFNVQAETKEEAFQKTADYLSQVAPSIRYEEIEQPISMSEGKYAITREDVESCIA